MDTIYIVIVVVLLALAAMDLLVGVANDAVNFLNSGVGSKVAPLWVILTVASAGVLLGSLFSSGMLEVARSGVFYPGSFTFNDIMLLFLAVMITDVILLDLFNTFGLPTSTTVSLVFELLGAAVAVALVNIWQSDSGVLTDYINSAKALTIISGILISVVIAFAVGSAVMYLSRLLFSFRYKNSFKYFGAVWAGLALTAISYFAIFKGLKGTTLIAKDTMQMLQDNIAVVLLYVWLGWSALMAILQLGFKVNILRIIILAGTSALALAFASNDLVNFIGVFMAGMGAYEIAADVVAQGGTIEGLYMGKLAEPVVADWRWLTGAGVIMILALWFSKKARTVTKTGVDLSRQGEGIERFSSSRPSRTIVRNVISLNKMFSYFIPKKLTSFLESRFEPAPNYEKNDASFDMIRAAVNLTVAALLISLGTSLKLPLSTTYVTFMVAMGSSLADRAWGRESAVYRITGVLTVVSGWFLTAFVAFSVSAIVAFILMYGGKVAVFAMLAVLVFILIQFMLIHKKRAKNEEVEDEMPINSTDHEIIVNCTKELEKSVETTIYIYKKMLEGLFNEDRKGLQKLYKMADELHGKSKHRRLYNVLPTIQKLDNDSLDTGQYFIQTVDYFYEISVSLRYMTESSYKFIDNNHEGFSKEQIEDLKLLGEHLLAIYNDFEKMMKDNNYLGLENIKERRAQILDLYAELVKKQITRTKEKASGTRNSILYLNLLNETKVIAMKSVNLMRAQMNLSNSEN